ncbi:MAG: TetR/AcrR family transcriptional regulator [Alphaproteobacteria bacterium]
MKARSGPPADAAVPKGKRAQTKETNRQAILDAAHEVFTELGYGETTVRDIIGRTGLASGTFYNYFRSKEEVFEALSDAAALKIRPRLKEVRSHARTLEDFLYATFEAYFLYVAEDHRAFALMRRNAGHIRVRMDTPEIMAGFDELKDDVARAMAEGLFPKIDVDYLCAALIGIAFEMAEQMLERPSMDAKEAARFATALVLGGIPAILKPQPA